MNTLKRYYTQSFCVLRDKIMAFTPKHMLKLSFSLLQRSAIPLVKPHNFMHPDDYLILEDESGRVKLTGTLLSPSSFVTGLCILHFVI